MRDDGRGLDQQRLQVGRIGQVGNGHGQAQIVGFLRQLSLQPGLGRRRRIGMTLEERFNCLRQWAIGLAARLSGQQRFALLAIFGPLAQQLGPGARIAFSYAAERFAGQNRQALIVPAGIQVIGGLL